MSSAPVRVLLRFGRGKAGICLKLHTKILDRGPHLLQVHFEPTETINVAFRLETKASLSTLAWEENNMSFVRPVRLYFVRQIMSTSRLW